MIITKSHHIEKIFLAFLKILRYNILYNYILEFNLWLYLKKELQKQKEIAEKQIGKKRLSKRLKNLYH